jgi:hypothetical protein
MGSSPSTTSWTPSVACVGVPGGAGKSRRQRGWDSATARVGVGAVAWVGVGAAACLRTGEPWPSGRCREDADGRQVCGAHLNFPYSAARGGSDRHERSNGAAATRRPAAAGISSPLRRATVD